MSQFTRRDFIKQSALTTAGIAVGAVHRLLTKRRPPQCDLARF